MVKLDVPCYEDDTEADANTTICHGVPCHAMTSCDNFLISCPWYVLTSFMLLEAAAFCRRKKNCRIFGLISSRRWLKADELGKLPFDIENIRAHSVNLTVDQSINGDLFVDRKY